MGIFANGVTGDNLIDSDYAEAKRYDSSLQVPGDHAVNVFAKSTLKAQRALDEYGDVLSGDERERLEEMATGKKKEGWFMKALEFIDRPRELISLGLADVLDLDTKVNKEISGEDYWNSLLGRSDAVRESLGTELYGKKGGFGAVGSDLLGVAGVENRFVKAVGGFAADVLLDPLTYLSFGTAGIGKKAAVEAGEYAVRQGTKAAVTAIKSGSKGSLRGFEAVLAKQMTDTAEPLSKALAKEIGDKLSLAEGRKLTRSETRQVWQQAQDGALEIAAREVEDDVLNSVVAKLGDKQFRSLEAAHPELLKYNHMPDFATGGVKVALPFGRKTGHMIELGGRTDRAVSAPVRFAMAKIADNMPPSVRDAMRDVWRRRGFEVPQLEQALKGNYAKHVRVVEGAAADADAVAGRGTASAVSSLLTDLHNVSKSHNLDWRKTEEKLVSLLQSNSEEFGGAHRALEGVDLPIPVAEKMLEVHDSIRTLLQTMHDAWTAFEPTVGKQENYFPAILTGDFSDMLERLAATSKQLPALPADADGALKLGEEFFTQLLAHQGRKVGQGAKVAGANQFARNRTVGKTMVFPTERIDAMAIDKAKIQGFWDILKDEGLPGNVLPHTELNRSVSAYVDYLVDKGVLSKRPKEFEAFNTDIAKVMDTYVTALRDSIYVKATARRMQTEGLLRPATRVVERGRTLAHIKAGLEDTHVAAIVDNLLDVKAGQRQATESILGKAVDIELVSGLTISVPANVANDEKVLKKVERLRQNTIRALGKEREMSAEVETKISALVRKGVPEELARPYVTATSEATLQETKAAIELSSMHQAFQLERIAQSILASARTVEETRNARAGLKAAREEASKVMNRARQTRRNLDAQWSRKLGIKEDKSVATTVDLLGGGDIEGATPRLAALADMIQQSLDAQKTQIDELLKEYDPDFQEWAAKAMAGTARDRQNLVIAAKGEQLVVDEISSIMSDELSMMLEASGVALEDVALYLTPVGFRDFFKFLGEKPPAEVTKAVSKWRRAVVGTNSTTGRADALAASGGNRAAFDTAFLEHNLGLTDDASEAISKTLSNEKIRQLEIDAKAALLRWADENKITMDRFTDVSITKGMSDDMVSDPVLRGLWEAVFATDPRAVSGEQAFYEWYRAMLDFQVEESMARGVGGAMGATLHSSGADVLAEMRLPSPNMKLIGNNRGKLRDLMEAAGLQAEGLNIRVGKTGVSASYTHNATRVEAFPVNAGKVFDEMDRLFPDLRGMTTPEKVGFLKTADAQTKGKLLDDVGASAEMRRFLTRVDEFGTMPAEFEILDGLDEFMAEVAMVRGGLKTSERSYARQLSEWSTLEKAWTPTRKALMKALDGGSITDARKVFDRNRVALRRILPREEYARIAYLLDYTQAVRNTRIPKSMLERNAEGARVAWQRADESFRSLNEFSAETSKLRSDKDLAKLAEEVDLLDTFKDIIARDLAAAHGARRSPEGLTIAPEGYRQLGDDIEVDALAGVVHTLADMEKRIVKIAQKASKDGPTAAYIFDIPPNVTDEKAMSAWADRKLKAMGGTFKVDTSEVADGIAVAPETINLFGDELGTLVGDESTIMHLENIAANARAVFTPYGIKIMGESARGALAFWKASATIGRPTFSIRNMIGGVFNNMIINVGLRDYAFVGMHGVTFRKIFNQTHDIGLALGALPPKVRTVWQAGLEAGVLDASFSSQLQRVRSGANKLSANPFNVQDFALNRAGIQMMMTTEDFLRMAAFSRHYNPANPASAKLAATLAHTVHFDYQNLTSIEQSIRKLVPFYVWSRRNIPLQIQNMIENPGLAAKYQHLMTNVAASSGDQMQDDLPHSPYLGGLAAGTGMVFDEDTPFWSRVMFDPQVGLRDVEELIDNATAGPTGWLNQVSNLLSPAATAPFELAASGEYGDVNAPAGLHFILRQLNTLGLWDDTTGAGDPRISYATRGLLETVLPQLTELQNVLGVVPTDPKRAARLGETTEDGVGLAERARGGALALGRGLGFTLQTPSDVPAVAFDIDTEVKKILADARLGGRIPPE